MAVAYVSDVEGQSALNDGNPLTLSSVNGGGGNYLIVLVDWRNNTGQTVSAITYGGNAVSSLGAAVTLGGGSIQAFGLANPSGTQNVSVALSAATPIFQASAIVLSGVDVGGTPIGTLVTQSQSGQTATSTGAATSAVDGLVVDGLFLRNSSTGMTAGGSQNQIAAQDSSTTLTFRASWKAGAASVTMSWTWTNAGTYGHIVIPINAAGTAAPSITNVDGDNVVTAVQTNVVITGTDFDTATVDIEQGAVTVAQSIDSQNSTTITFDMVFDSGPPDLKHGAATLRVTNDDDQDDTQAITINPESGTNYVNLTSVDPIASQRITAIPDLEAGDQLQWGNVQGGVIGDVTVNNDATFECDEAVTSFDVRAWSADDTEWGNWATQDVSGSFTTTADQQRDRRRRGMLIPIWGRG